ncbi:MAG: glutamate---cysteine ligase / carboxylate-amine ligase [Variibacter sp.]|nr:glutamate---cysteine ligase / carboxylate-amine ligase [Variibacter sp.]
MCKYRFGIEEEYFLVNRRSARLRCELPQAFMKAAKRKLGDQLMNEILQSQVEIATHPLTTPAEGRDELMNFRSTLAEIGKQHGVGIVAAGTHPLAYPNQQRMTRKRRYSKVIEDLGMVGLGNPLCGLHVHVEVPEPDLRVGIMHRLVPFLPLLLALSTSSPFWAGCDTGLLGYRNAANDALPRTGFPEMFQSLADYESYVEALVKAEIIADSTYIWWALRPSLQHPTLELRLTDCCTSAIDAVAIASLYRAVVRHLTKHRSVNKDFSAVSRALAEENRWTAQRRGTQGTYVDVATRAPQSFDEMLEQTISLVAEDVEALGLEGEMRHLRQIARRGTSAHLQLKLYRTLLKFGRSRTQAMAEVAKWLTASTEAGDFIVGEAASLARSPPRAAAGGVGLAAA